MEQEFELGPLQERWLSLLESGKFKQAKNRLKNPKTGGFCCLGIACEHVLNMVSEVKQGKNVYFYHGPKSSEQYLPGVSYRKLGMYSRLGCIRELHVRKKDQRWVSDRRFYNLASMNDSRVSFKRIAKFIRDNPRAIFEESK